MSETMATEPQASSRSTESGSLGRGLQVLGVLHAGMRAMSLTDVSDASGLAPSTTHRLLQALVELGQAARTSGGRYMPSARSLVPLPLDHPLSALRRDCAELLRNLCARHGPSTSLVVFLGNDRVVLEYAPGRYSVTPYYDTHLDAPYHATTSGKILLSGLSSAKRAALLGPTLDVRTPETHLDPQLLDRELDQVRLEGFATNMQENVAGICACGARLSSPSGRPIGAIVMSGPGKYFSADAMLNMKRDLLESAGVLNKTSSALRALARFLE